MSPQKTNKILLSRRNNSALIDRLFLFVLFMVPQNLIAATNNQAPQELEWYGDHARAQLIRDDIVINESIRTYSLSTTQRLRHNQGQQRQISEDFRFPRLRTGHLLFDATFALAMTEVQAASARGDKIYDGAFNWGNGIDCRCFETGEKWPYVWTRDISYSLYLGLPMLDVSRSLESLNFKTSTPRLSEKLVGPQIVQDTGSGGSWPISTDRVVWALAGQEIMEYLEGPELSAFERHYADVLQSTVEADRIAVWDPKDGLYRGETSFLDWREQSYPRWVQNNVVLIGESKALSTNVLHYVALRNLGTLLNKFGRQTESAKYLDWARHLKMAINRELWMPGEQTYAAIKWGYPISTTSPRLDLLGLSLTLLHDIADPDRAQKVLEKYPHTAQGAPVIWPQVPDVPIYHNRAIWPFVSALWTLAAKKYNHPSIVHHNLMTLVRGAALNLSNMENFEFLTLANYFYDNELSGPVVNSARQLWSVAGYMAVVVRGIFGVALKANQVEVRPFLSESTRREFFSSSKEIELRGLNLRGRIVDIRLILPPEKALASGSYSAEQIILNGQKNVNPNIAKMDVNLLDNPGRNQIDVFLKVNDDIRASWTLLPDYRPKLPEEVVQRLWAPEEPLVSSVDLLANNEKLRIVSVENRKINYIIYRNGERLAEIPRTSTTTEWLDSDLPTNLGDRICYTVFAVDQVYNLWSFPSQPKCITTNKATHLTRFSPDDGKLTSPDQASLSHKHGRLHFEDWGHPSQSLQILGFSPSVSGTYSMIWEYGNAHAPISTGATAGVKQLLIKDREKNEVTASPMFFFPQMTSWDTWGQSNRQTVELKANTIYDFYLVDFFNMTYLDHFRLYTANPGGNQGPINRINLSHLDLWLEHY